MPVEFLIDGMAAPVSYAGLVQNLVGLYQFNVDVPQNASPGVVTLKVLVNGEEMPQTLHLFVGQP